MRALPATLALCLVLAWPAASALVETRVRTYSALDLQTIHNWANLTLSGADAAGVRGEADTDDDGQVSAAEVAAYAQYLKDRSAEELRDNPQARLDGQDPSRQGLDLVVLRGLEGPTASLADVEYDLRYALEYAHAGPDPNHRLEREARSTDKGPVKVVVPQGYKLLMGKGIRDFRVSGDGREVSGSSDGGSDLSVRFLPAALVTGSFSVEPAGGGGAGAANEPAPAAWATLAALFAVVAVRAARRM